MKVRWIFWVPGALLLVVMPVVWWLNLPSNLSPELLPPEPRALAGEDVVESFTEDLTAEYLQGYGSDASTPERDLEQVKDVIDAFVRSVKIPGALPTGSNRELVAALAGENAHRIRFLDSTMPWMNADGELVDRWRVPLFFHFVEANDVGVRSAGPDRVMWNADDVLMGEHALSE